MLDYLNKFNSLPQYLKDKMSEPSILAAIKELEEKYEISLAAVVMKIMVKDISILDLAKYFVFEYNLNGQKAEELVNEMKEKVLFVSADYLGFETKVKKDLIGINQKKGHVVNKVKTSNFFFSSEDEEEVSKLTQDLGPKDKTKEINEEVLKNTVNNVIFETGVSFSSEELSERFVKVLKTYARGVRNKIDTKITLSKDVDKGGLGMSDGRVDEVLKSLDKHNGKKDEILAEIKLTDDSIEEKPAEKEKESSKKPGIDNFRKKVGGVNGQLQRDTEYDLSAMPKKTEPVKKKKIKTEPLLDSKGLPVSKPKKENILTSSSPAVKPSIKIETKNLADRISGTDGKFKSRTATSEATRKKVEDVKIIPKLSGPVEELANMNIVDFRRLDTDPMRAAAKIKEKINLLEESGFRKKLDGIAAWRQSKINKEYIDIGRKSIGQKKPINDIISDKNMSGHDTLREEEFEAILNLNREIRF